MTSFTAGERSAVSIVHRASFSVGGSRKRHDERCSGASENGVGQERRPTHTTKNGKLSRPAHPQPSALEVLWEAIALRASRAGSA